MFETRHINLTVPTGWNQCTTRQLEAIAQIILRRTAMQDRYHPYDPLQMKTEAFFALAGLEITGTVHAVSSEAGYRGTVPSEFPGDDAGEEGFMARFIDRRPWIIRAIRSRKKEPPFPIAVWQVHSFVKQHLGWLDNFTSLWIFPYEQFGHYFTFDRRLPFLHRHKLKGPQPLLDGMTWRQYRFASEWLSAYTSLTNQIEQAPATNSQLSALNSQLKSARCGFLRALFSVIDLPRTPRQLRRMRPDQFQLCLIWWQSMMSEMQRKYKRCFSVNRKQSTVNPQNPIDLYTRSTATLQDKYHLTEEQINLQPCRVILQHLEDMAREAEELEKISRKNKTK